MVFNEQSLCGECSNEDHYFFAEFDIVEKSELVYYELSFDLVKYIVGISASNKTLLQIDGYGFDRRYISKYIEPTKFNTIEKIETFLSYLSF